MSSSPEAEDGDIYGDLPNVQFDTVFKNLERDNAVLQAKVAELGTQLVEMKKENDKLQAKIKALGKNISCLYKTSQREIMRKEQIIADLRKERDDLLFRRGLQDARSPNIRRPSRKQLTPTKKVRNGSIKMFQETRGKSEVNLMERNQKEIKHVPPLKSEFENTGCVRTTQKDKEKTVTHRTVPEPVEVVELADSPPESNCDSVNKSTEDSERKCSLTGHGSVLSMDAVLEEKTQISSDVNRNEVMSPDQKPLLKECKNIGPIPAKQNGEARKTQHEKVPDTDSITGTNTTREAERNTSLAVDVQVSNTSALEERCSIALDANKSIEMTTPVQDKVSVHMSSEDCGFGRRRVRRVIKPAATSTSPVKAEDKSISCPTEEKDNIISHSSKRLHLEIDPGQNDPRVEKRRRVDQDSLPKRELQGSTSENVMNGPDSISHSCQEKSVNSSEKTDSCDLLVLKYKDHCNKDNDADVFASRVLEKNPNDNTSLWGQRDKYMKEKCDRLTEKKGAESSNKGIDSDILKRYRTSFGVSAFEDTGKQEKNVSRQNDRNVTLEELVNEMLSTPTVQRPGHSVHEVKNYGHDRLIENLHSEYGSRNSSPTTQSCASETFNSPIASPRDEESTNRRSWDRERIDSDNRPSDYMKNDMGKRYSDQHGGTGHGHAERRRDFHEEREQGRYYERTRGAQRRGHDRSRSSYSGSKSGHYKDQERSRGDEGRESKNDKGRYFNRRYDRRRDLDRKRHSNYDRDLHRGWDSDRGPDSDRRRSRESDKSKDSDRERNSSRERDRVKGHRSSRDWPRGSSRDRGRCSRRDSPFDSSRDQNQSSSVDRDCRYSRDRDDDGNKDESKDPDWERDTEQYRGNKNHDRRGYGEFGANADLRGKLLNKSLTTARGKANYDRRNGYKDLDKSPEDEGEWSGKWCDKKRPEGDKTGQQSPEKQSGRHSEQPNQADRPITPEWD